MPYYAEKSDNTWRLTWREGKKIARNVPKDSVEAKQAGFSESMPLAEAKARAKQLQSEAWVKREADKQARSRALLEKYAKLRSAFLTDEDAEEFERNYLPEYKIRRPHWNTMQKIIVDVGLHPSEWFKRKSLLYEQFKKKRCSPNYAKKLLRYLNIWAYFLCEKQKRAFLKVPGMEGTWKNRLEDARRPGGRSKPLSPTLLEDQKKHLDAAHYKWLFLSVWFGLRPEEVDNLLSVRGRLWDIEKSEEWGWVLSVFQTKLYKRGVSKEYCWKFIPTYFPEQKKAVEYILEKGFTRPKGEGGKLMRRVFGDGHSLYAGRNNFSGMLRDAGFDLETRRRWLGHMSVKTTESYDRKTEAGRVFFRPPAKKTGT